MAGSSGATTIASTLVEGICKKDIENVICTVAMDVNFLYVVWTTCLKQLFIVGDVYS
jgi:hypothetical protein